MPPREQWLWVEGLGPNSSSCGPSRRLSSSMTIPGSTTQVFCSVSTEIKRLQYFVQSMTTAALVHCPPSLDQTSREWNGAPNRAHTSTADYPGTSLRAHNIPHCTCF